MLVRLSGSLLGEVCAWLLLDTSSSADLESFSFFTVNISKKVIRMLQQLSSSRSKGLTWSFAEVGLEIKVDWLAFFVRFFVAHFARRWMGDADDFDCVLGGVVLEDKWFDAVGLEYTQTHISPRWLLFMAQ